jgi:hypothetical protein
MFSWSLASLFNFTASFGARRRDHALASSWILSSKFKADAAIRSGDQDDGSCAVVGFWHVCASQVSELAKGYGSTHRLFPIGHQTFGNTNLDL